MCRQVFGFRLAMIVVSAPAALLNAAPGLGARLVGAAVVVTFMVSYVLFRDWERFGPLLLRHPSLLAADTVFGSFLLVSAGPDTTLAYVSVCTPLLAGLVYSWRGAACFASLQSLILLLVQATLKADRHAPVAEALLLPGLCVIAGAMGSTLRNLMLRFGAATQALTTVQARLAAAEAVSAERARLAREMHDSVAKTLYGVALAADGLAATASTGTPDPARLREQAELVSRSARRAAAESRELLTDLRRNGPQTPDHASPLWQELEREAMDLTSRTGLQVTCHWAWGEADGAGREANGCGREANGRGRETNGRGREANGDWGEAGGTVPDGAPPGGAVSDGAVSEGAASEGAVSEGAASHGAASDVAASDGAPPLAPPPLASPPLAPALTRHILAIATEALENAHRHASATRVDVRASVDGHLLRLTIHDDGIGLPPGTTLERLRGSGHFGLLGMAERAAQAGARIRIGRGTHERGTEVRLDIPLPSRPPSPPYTGSS
ncbi:histidine kinase [Streptomyces sp. Go40/10]|uniref:sensor histidine kinase n=1 Tax=Streptomyces sp. Go40/10 TaxID=2825844 RepID=UPI001E49825B|nr:histidine kinase [Streptomyces sp. Go40/10]UFR07385.1 histidine kinase [Streptomyces sp. Go40/10]